MDTGTIKISNLQKKREVELEPSLGISYLYFNKKKKIQIYELWNRTSAWHSKVLF